MKTRPWRISLFAAILLAVPTTVSRAADVPVPPPTGEVISIAGFEDTDAPAIENCMMLDPGFVECPTLREAVMYANSSSEPSMDTIMLSEGTYTLTRAGADEIFLPCEADPSDVAPDFTNTPDASTGDLDITESLVIQGAGADLTVVQWGDWSGNPDPATTERVFHVYSDDGTVNIFTDFRGLTVRNGLLLKTDDLCEGPPSEFGLDPTAWRGMRAGGGIAIGAAANTVLYDPNLEGAENSDGRGGSQRPDDHIPSGTYTVTLNDVDIRDNSSDGDGGGLYNAGPLTAYDIGIIGNVSGTNGGGIYNEGLTIIDAAVVASNEAEGGGGLFVTGNPDMPVDIRNSTFSDNVAIGGGAISGRVVPIRIVNSTISRNTGTDVGGGLYSNGIFELVHVTIADNLASGAEAFGGAGINVFNAGNVGVTLIDTLLSNNTAGAADRPANCGCTGSQTGCVTDADRKIQTLGYNLADDATCNLSEVGDLTQGIDPLIGPLADNGGLTETHALLAGSPALGAGIAVAEATSDQRGVLRDAPPDIGAFEEPTPGINVIKEVTDYIDADGSRDVSAGDTINYGYTVQNIGVVDPRGVTDLTGVTLVDDKLGPVMLSDVAGDGVSFIAAGDLETATASYVVQESDLGTDIVNVATADSDQTEPDTDSATVTVPAPESASNGGGGGGGGSCSMQTAGTSKADPTLPLLVLAALVYLGARRSRHAR